MNVLVINCGSSSLKYRAIDRLKQRQFLQKVFARESASTEDLYIRNPDATKKLQKLLCLHIKKQSRWFLMRLQTKKQAQSRA